MPSIPEKLTVRLGPLKEPLEEYCAEYAMTPSQAIREALSGLLGVDEPEMPEGNPAFRDQG